MPNYVATEIRVKGDKEKLDQLVETVSSNDGEYRAFDFNKIVPMPEELNISSGTSGEWGMRYIILKSDKDDFLLSDEDRNFIKQFESTVIKHGMTGVVIHPTGTLNGTAVTQNVAV